ncbi:MAG: patatin-like phospholipase family protein [Myxococcales bacterium]|nr:patatin-like phospholipase family protein [Myxococcales bacterium]
MSGTPEASILRLVVTLYGGNARMPFEAGVAFALFELLVASRRAHGKEAPSGLPWLDGLGPLPDVHLDVVAGASAGGIVGAVLAKMLVASSDPVEDFRKACEVFVDDMDLRNMKVAAPPTDANAPAALFDKRQFTIERMGRMLAERRTEQAIEPDAELHLSLTHAVNKPEWVDDPGGRGEPVADPGNLDTRRFDRLDFHHRVDAITDAIEATSATPFGFSAHFIADRDSPEGHAEWLRARAPFDPLLPREVPDLPPPVKVPCYDGGALDNRPVGAAVDAALRRGLGLEAGERLALLLIDPADEARTDEAAPALAGSDRRRAAQLADQLASAGAATAVLLQDRVSSDLRRLVDWKARVALWTHTGCVDQMPAETALIEAVNQLLFGGAMPSSRLNDLDVLGLAHTLASQTPAARQGLLLAGQRAQRLLRMRQRVLRERAGAGAADGLTVALERTDALLEAEMAAIDAQVDRAASGSARALHQLLIEALSNTPLPPVDAGRPLDLTIRRVGPPAGGLASWWLGGMTGFLEPEYRAHDLVVGLIRGRVAVAELLPGAAARAWRARFALPEGDASIAAAVEWFVAPAHQCALPWRDWARTWGAVERWRGADWHDLPLAERAARERERLQPRAAATVAYASERLWTLAATTSPLRDNALYATLRGPLGVLARFIVPWLSRRAAAGTPTGRWLSSMVGATGLTAALAFAWLGVVAGVTAWLFSVPLAHVAFIGLVTIAGGAALPLAVILWHHLLVRRVVRLDDPPPVPVARIAEDRDFSRSSAIAAVDKADPPLL